MIPIRILSRIQLDYFILTWIVVAIVVFFILMKRQAPYGRYFAATTRNTVDSQQGWIAMELISLISFILIIIWSNRGTIRLFTWIPIVLFCLHYLYRSLIFPFKIEIRQKKMPVSVFYSAVLFNLINSSVNGYYLVSHHPVHALDIRNWIFVSGFVLFSAGISIHIISDKQLIRLRKHSSEKYSIPDRGLFVFVSCPNYLGEIIQWAGFALMAWNLAAFSFAVWTMANLVPRALSHHRWYKATFGTSYPVSRRAIVPFIL